MWLFNFKDDTKFKIQFPRHTSYRSSAWVAAVAAAGVSGSEDAELSREYRKACVQYDMDVLVLIVTYKMFKTSEISENWNNQ